ncbi:hypothetical protein W911_09395 [Hyphomicrobium nitrativorans NL23]|uniref:SPOR domain-containing protein n=1 Tax=Hyphomicrobium nitrativorans NL23 TaxID=1029756 RepID=V5SJL7_9HYPH|nr:SPOR domain-containing protein [Hyphomicrobium nitrativorans]AHB50154.1 hypothetical protein W911_09395 [Hyphomicrobium nitrativorans NL23]
MNAFDRDTELERRQIHEISINVARRLLDVLERRNQLPPAVASEIVSGARAIAEIQREIDGIMTALPHGGMLDMAVLTHVLANHNRALSLVEDLEVRTGGRGAARHPDPERTHAALIATAREIERETRFHGTGPASQARSTAPPNFSPPQPEQYTAAYTQPSPQRAHGAPPSMSHGNASPPAPAHAMREPVPAAAVRPPRRQPPPQQHLQPRPSPAAVAAATPRTPLRALVSSPVGAVALVTGIAILAASLAGAVSFALSNGDASEESHMAARTSGGKFDGRLTAGDAASAGGADILVVTPPANAAPLAQPYLVVLATRPSTDELDRDFRYFKEAHPQLLGDARGRVDTMQSQDGKTWHRLSLIPPRSQEEAASLCAELKAAGLTECWIKPLPLGRDATR